MKNQNIEIFFSRKCSKTGHVKTVYSYNEMIYQVIYDEVKGMISFGKYLPKEDREQLGIPDVVHF
ncbi:MAG TPA: hypothetical protein PKG96_05455 [Bacilli bacterium]|nr:hypothetical protein [Bacilli bacterium]